MLKGRRNEMFAVVFERNDQKPDEVYYYNKKDSAEYHFDLFSDDDSGMYSKISIIDVDEKREIRYNRLDFDAMM